MFVKYCLIFLCVCSAVLASPMKNPNDSCKQCHPKIYQEYQKSMHAKATIWKDPIHKAVWDKHPLKNKKEQYKCAKCHTPSADNLSDMLEKGKKGLPDSNNPTHTQAISCVYCHNIESVSKGKMSNTNKLQEHRISEVYNADKHFSIQSEIFRSGQVCMGCHSHKKNKEQLDVCVTDIGKMSQKDNCIQCHMPQMGGSETKHSFHGFAGANANADMLSKYISLDFEKKKKAFMLSIYNASPHNLMLHPLRLTQLQVSLERDGKIHELKTHNFVRVLGKNKKPAPPWLANSIIKDTMVKAKDTRRISYIQELQKEDKIHVRLGYYLVNPKAVKKLGLQDYAKAKKFFTLKEKIYIVE